MRVLITAGGTEEPIDSVRRLTNVSTGATGVALARRFADRGVEVWLLHAARVAVGDGPFERAAFVSCADLGEALRRLLGEHRMDAVIHAAAVGDYAVAGIEVDGAPWAGGSRGKIASGHELLIRLRPNPKLIDSLRSWSANPDLRVVGFKLTDEPDPARRRLQVRALLERASVDYVVHNDLAGITPDRHRASIFDRSGELATVQTKLELADALHELLDRGGAA